MAKGAGAIDFVGYAVGQPAIAAPAGGLRGAVDFVGYRVGAPAAVPPAGGTYRMLMMGIGCFVFWFLSQSMRWVK